MLKNWNYFMEVHLYITLCYSQHRQNKNTIGCLKNIILVSLLVLLHDSKKIFLLYKFSIHLPKCDS